MVYLATSPVAALTTKVDVELDGAMLPDGEDPEGDELELAGVSGASAGAFVCWPVLCPAFGVEFEPHAAKAAASRHAPAVLCHDPTRMNSPPS
jgi:hypothetical protein